MPRPDQPTRPSAAAAAKRVRVPPTDAATERATKEDFERMRALKVEPATQLTPALARAEPPRRSARMLMLLLDELDAAGNPRYVPTEPSASLAHRFVGDLAMALACHFPPAQAELPLSGAVAWLRTEALSCGWALLSSHQLAVLAAKRGELVVAVAKSSRVYRLAVVIPKTLGPDGFPFVASAGRPRGNALPLQDAVARDVVYFHHR